MGRDTGAKDRVREVAEFDESSTVEGQEEAVVIPEEAVEMQEQVVEVCVETSLEPEATDSVGVGHLGEERQVTQELTASMAGRRFPTSLPDQPKYNALDAKGRRRVWVAWTQYLWSLYRQAKAGPQTIMNEWLRTKPDHVTEFIHTYIDLFSQHTHVGTCVVQQGRPYYFIMQPISSEVEAEVETDGIWSVERFVDERTRIGPMGAIYGVQFERFSDTYSIQSADVQNGPLKAAARKRLKERLRKEAEERGERFRMVARQRQRSTRRVANLEIVISETFQNIKNTPNVL